MAGTLPRLIYACSGAADVGAIADQTVRKLSREGLGKMSCLAALGANLENFIESARKAENLVIDGCPVACAHKNLERVGVPHRALVLTEMGLEKGQSPCTDAVVDEMAEKIRRAAGRADAPGPDRAGHCNCG